LYVTNDFITTGVTNQTATVTFHFDVLLSDTNSYSGGSFGWANGGVVTNKPPALYDCAGSMVVAGTITAPQTGVSIPYVTDQAGDVVFHPVFFPCGTNIITAPESVLTAARPPRIELYSYYPDPSTFGS